MTLDYDTHAPTVEDIADHTGQTTPTELDTEHPDPPARRSRLFSTDKVVYVLLPAVAMLLALGVGYLNWRTGSVDSVQRAASESVSAATETTIALLSYQPDAVDRELPAAADRLTGAFRDEYLTLINDVVIPGAKEKQISASVTIPAAASISAEEKRAQVLVFVNQSTTFADGTPSSSVSSVRITLEKEGDRWLVSQFEPV